VLSAAAFVGTWNFTFLSPVLPSVADDTNVSVSVAGQLVTVSALVTVIAVIVLGPLSDRYGRRPTLMAGVTLMALAALGSAVTSDYSILMSLRVVSGIADALVLPSAAAAISDYYRDKDREVALNLLLIPMGGAAVIGLPLVALIDNAVDWHAAFLVFAGINVSILAGVLWLLPPVAAQAPATQTLADHYRESYGEVLGTRTAIIVLSAAILGATVWNGTVTYAAAFFEDELGAGGTTVSGLFAALGVAYVIGGAFGAFMAMRAPPKPIALWSAIIASFLLIPLIASASVPAIAVVIALAFAASRAPGIAALNNMLLDLAPSSQGTAIATYGVVAASGALVGAGTGGAAIALEGYAGMAALFTILAVGSVLLLLAPTSERVPEPVTTTN
jgi:predicted MFS family arabinose efflux permease